MPHFSPIASENFDKYWKDNWIPTNQPAVFDLAMREIAEKAYHAGVASTMNNEENNQS